MAHITKSDLVLLAKINYSGAVSIEADRLQQKGSSGLFVGDYEDRDSAMATAAYLIASEMYPEEYAVAERHEQAVMDKANNTY